MLRVPPRECVSILRDCSMILPFYCVLSLTDILDGALARKLHATSNIGRYLDVVTDFTLLFSISSATCFRGYIIRFYSQLS